MADTDILMSDFDYILPEERIAKYPLEERDSSKLLEYADGKITEHVFRNIADLLPENSVMVFNDTRVVPARLHFMKPTGAHVEIFCLEPRQPAEYNLIFAETECCRWKCIVGNVKRWKSGRLMLCGHDSCPEAAGLGLEAELIERDGETSIIEFTWKNGMPFSRILEICGTVPIPPYLNRESESIDSERYQTLYARYRGSVAAPTAGLHFTERVLASLKARGIDMETVCLHVGAGTFLPVKSEGISGHTMHREPFSVDIGLLRRLRDRSRRVIAVGTTSVRTLESLYYAGVLCIEEGCPHDIPQWMPYGREFPYSFEEAMDALISYLERNSMDSLKIGTRIIIVPGFRFRATDILVTNFHQPQSTLLLLVSAFVGGNWREIYDYALSHGFRFLSYGDSSLLFKA